MYNRGNGTALLYPVYSWIPVNGAVSYEIEILNSLPDRSDRRAPLSKIIGRGTSRTGEWYDEDRRVSSSPMYWRVRGLDADGVLTCQRAFHVRDHVIGRCQNIEQRWIDEILILPLVLHIVVKTYVASEGEGRGFFHGGPFRRSGF